MAPFPLAAPGRFRLAPLLMAAVTAIGFWLRLVDLERANIWWDEGWTALLARFDPSTLVTWLLTFDLHPPLHYWTLGIWRMAAGEDVFALRFTSVLAGTLAIPVVWAIGRRLGGDLAGVSAALLLAIARFHIWWSQEIRMYALAVLLGAISVYVFLRIIDGDRRRLLLAGFVAVTTLGMLTQYLFALIALSQAVVVGLRWLAAPRARTNELLTIAGCFVGSALLYVPWLVLYLGTARPWQGEPPLDWDLFRDLYVNAMPLGVSTDLSNWSLAAAALWGAVIVGVVAAAFGGSRQRWIAGLLVLLAIGAPLLVYLASTLPNAPLQPKLGVRYLVIFVPAFVVLAGLGLATAWRWSAVTGAALTALAVAAAVPALGAYYAERNPAPDIPLAARSIQALARPGDVVILNPGRDWPVFRYYAPGVADWLVIEPTDRLTDERASDLLSRVAAENSGAWLVTSRETATVDPGAAARTWLERNYRDAGGYSAGQTEVRLFTPDAARRLAPDAMPGRLAGITPTTRLYVADGIPPAVRHGEQWPLLLGWERNGDAGVASVRLSLVSNEGRGFPGRRQNLPAGARAVTPLTLAVTDSIPPGRYQLNVDLMQGDLVETTFGLGWTTVQGGLPGRHAAALVDVGAVFGGQIELAGYRAEIGADGQLVLDLAWRATNTPPDVNYTVFVHLVDGEDRRVDQRDRQPQEGRAPTSAWQPGASVIDSYRFPWTLERRDRGVRAVVGLYLPTTGQRLELAGGGTSVDLPLP